MTSKQIIASYCIFTDRHVNKLNRKREEKIFIFT